MRGIEELDHYEMLEIPRGASPGEIDRAYRLAQQTYAEGSLALYSIFEKRDAAEIRARLDEAYRVLADPELRSSYDLEHRAELTSSALPASAARATSAPSPAPRATNGHAASAPIASSSSRLNGAVAPVAANGTTPASRAAVFDDLVEGFDGQDDGSYDGLNGGQYASQNGGLNGSQYDAHEDDGRSGEFDGQRLRRTRLFRGFEIDQIADVTKVAGSHLRNIEDENFADLPADVYVRGFVTAYAKTIGLDPQAVVPSYMARLQDSRQKSQKSRFLGLR